MEMKTTQQTETEMLLEHAMTGKPLDPEVYRKIKERGRAITEQIRQQFGVRDIAADLIRESREER